MIVRRNKFRVPDSQNDQGSPSGECELNRRLVMTFYEKFYQHQASFQAYTTQDPMLSAAGLLSFTPGAYPMAIVKYALRYIAIPTLAVGERY